MVGRSDSRHIRRERHRLEAILSFAFLPEEVDRVKGVLAKVKQMLEGDAIMARWGDYDRFLDTLEDVKARHKVLNGATAVMLMVEIVERELAKQEEQDE